MATVAPCRSIWDACKRGDHDYVDEYIRQQPSSEDQHRNTARSTSKRGGGGASSGNRGGASAPAQAASASSAYTLAGASSTAVLVDDGLGLLSADGSTLLHCASLFQRRRVVRTLTASGGMDPAVRDRESGWNAMHHALYRGDFLTAAVLLQGAPSVAASGATHADADAHTPLDLVGVHVREASAARRARSNGSGRTAATDASGQPVRFVRESALTAQSSAFAALSVSATAESSPAPFNLLYSFGYQSHWTLGYSADHYQHKARLVDSLSHSSVQQVVALRQALFVLDEHGAVYSCGQGASGKLGHESRETLIQPKRIAALQSSVVTFIAGSDDFMLAVNNKGQGFAWGQCAFLDGSAAATTSSSKGGKLQSGTSSPPTTTRSLDSSAATAAASSSAATASKFSQLPRRLECLRGHAVSRIYPSSTRLIFQTTDDAAADDDELSSPWSSSASQLWFVGQSIEDADRWESLPKRFASSLPPGESSIRSVFNHDDFVALLTGSGTVRIQRRGERKLNKVWLQNYRADAPPRGDTKAKSIRDLFPLIPNAHVVRMAFSADGKRGAAVTFSGQLFLWKLAAPEYKTVMGSPPFGASGSAAGSAAMPSLSLFAAAGSASSTSASTAAPAPARSPAPSYSRTIGYLVEGLAHVRVTDVSVTSGHTSVITEDGHVYSFGPTAIGHVHPSVAAASAQQPVLRPKRLLHLNQVKRIVASDQYVTVLVSIARPPVLPSFPEMRGVFELERKLKLSAVAVPSLRMLCEHHLAGQITPLSVVSAYQWAAQTASPHLLRFCTHFLLLNLPFYLPSLLALPDIECLQYLQREYAATYPMWWTSPQHSQPFQPLDCTDGHAAMLTNPEADAAAAAESAGESFSFSHALAQLKAAAVQAALPKTTEERVGEIKLRRRALRKKLVQIDALEQMHARKVKLDAEQHDKIKQKAAHLSQVEALDSELQTLRDNGSVSAAKLWDRLHGIVGAEDDEAENVPAAASVVPVSAPAPAVPAAAPVEEKEQLASTPAQPQSRVAAELIDRPVRALVKEKTVETTPKKYQRAAAPASATKPAAAALPPSGLTSSTAAASAPTPASWKPAVVAAPAVAAAREPVVRAAAPPATSFAAIQAEEARAAAAAAAAAQRPVRSNPSKSAASSIIAAVGIGGGKGWGVSPAAASTSPALHSVAAPSSSFPSLGSAAMGSPTKGASSTAFAQHSSPALKSSPSLKSPLVASVASPSTRALVGGLSAPLSTFSLADFMPALPSQPAKPAAPLKTWNVPGAVAVLEPTSAQKAAAASSSADKRKGKKAGAASTVAAAGPAVPAAPLSLLEIQRAEELCHYGSASASLSKRDRELDELEAASAPRSAWNSTHMVSAAAMQAQPTLAELQGEQLSAILAEEERLKRNAEKKERQKEMKAKQKAVAAALAAAKAASLASAPASVASVPPAGAPASDLGPRPASAAPRGGGRGGGRGGRGGSRPVTAAPQGSPAAVRGRGGQSGRGRGRGGARPPSTSAAAVPPAPRLVCVETNPGPCSCGAYTSDEAQPSNAKRCDCKLARVPVPAASEAASSIQHPQVSLSKDAACDLTNSVVSFESPVFCPCVGCKAPTQRRCSRCHLVYYCDEECQRQTYSVHKPFCSLLASATCVTSGCPNTRISADGHCLRHSPADVAIDLRTTVGYSCFLHDWDLSQPVFAVQIPLIVHSAVVRGVPLVFSRFLVRGKSCGSVTEALATHGSALSTAISSKVQSSSFIRNVLLTTGSRQLIDSEDAELGPALMELREAIRAKLIRDGRLSCLRCVPPRLYLCEAHLALHCIQAHSPSRFVCAACNREKGSDQFSAAQRSILLSRPRCCIECESLHRPLPSTAHDRSGDCRFLQEDFRWNGYPSYMSSGRVVPCLGPDHHPAAAGLTLGAPWRCGLCSLCSHCQFYVSGHRAAGVESQRTQLNKLIVEPCLAVIRQLEPRFSESVRSVVARLNVSMAFRSQFTADDPVRVHGSSCDGVVYVCCTEDDRDLNVAPQLYALKFPKEVIVYDPDRELYGFAMPYVPPHVSLSELIHYQMNNRNKPMHDATTTMHIVTQLATTLAAMHEAGVAHLDLHWGNVLLTLRHELFIIDLGRADLFVQDNGSSNERRYVECDRRQWRWLVERLYGHEHPDPTKQIDPDFGLTYPPCLESMLVTNERDFDYLTMRQIVDQLAACQCDAHLRPFPTLAEECPDCAEVNIDPPPPRPRGSSSR